MSTCNIKMSLVTNRKRPRGFSESFDTSSGKTQSSKASNTKTSTIPLNFDATSSKSSSSTNSTYNNSSPTENLNIGMDVGSDATLDTSSNSFKLNSIEEGKFPTRDNYVFIDEDNENVIEEGDEDEEDDDDVVILSERQLNLSSSKDKPKTRRNNSDSMLLDHDAFVAYNMFNVNNYYSGDCGPNSTVGTSKKQRTNSLPQLPQVKCMYNKLPSNYILKHPKLGNIKTNVIPHQLNLPPCDDKDGHYIIKIGDLFANRFLIIKMLGQGTFGKVVECFDKVNREHVAIKIIRNIPKYRDAAKIELRILSTLKKFDNENINHCIHLRECFDYRNHICIVTDLLMISLYDFLENNKFIAFPGSHIQAVSKQLIRSVTFLHDLNLIHTDLKPENILLHDDSFVKKQITSSTIMASYLSLTGDSEKKLPKYSKILNNPLIQVIDFGSAIFNDEYHSSIVSTRHYRAPEIVLGVGWSFPCDMWSIGCILVELIIGEPLFKTHDNLEHLAMIEKVCGCRIDKSMVQASKQKENECGLNYFVNEYTRDGQDDFSDDDDVIIDDESSEENSLTLIFPSSSTPAKFITNVNKLSRIDLFISSRIGLNINFDYSLSENYQNNKHIMNFGNFTFWWFFMDLLRQLFVINPEERITAVQAMQHPWFNLGIEDEGTI